MQSLPAEVRCTVRAALPPSDRGTLAASGRMLYSEEKCLTTTAAFRVGRALSGGICGPGFGAVGNDCCELQSATDSAESLAECDGKLGRPRRELLEWLLTQRPIALTGKAALRLRQSALQYDDHSTLKLLISHGIYSRQAMNSSVDHRAAMTMGTALHASAEGGLERTCGVLLRANADPNVQDEDGNTPMHLANAAGHARVVQLLISHGGSRIITNEFGALAGPPTA